jgi:hypothetical protein
MIETRPQNAGGGDGETGNLEACRISATAVSARGYNIGAASRNARSHQLSFAND